MVLGYLDIGSLDSSLVDLFHLSNSVPSRLWHNSHAVNLNNL